MGTTTIVTPAISPAFARFTHLLDLTIHLENRYHFSKNLPGFGNFEGFAPNIFLNWQQKSALEIRQAVIEDVRQFIGKQKVYDDITLLVLKQQ